MAVQKAAGSTRSGQVAVHPVAVQEAADVAHSLPDAVAVLHQPQPDIAFTVLAEANTR